MFDLIIGWFVKLFLLFGTVIVGVAIKLDFGDPDFMDEPSSIVMAYTMFGGLFISFIWAISR